MSEIIFSAQDIITLSALIGAIVAIVAVVSKPFKTLDRIDKSVAKMEKAVSLHGDMIAELLEHNIDGNNTGRMREVKKKFDDTYRNEINV
jgi:hypothetical protein